MLETVEVKRIFQENCYYLDRSELCRVGNRNDVLFFIWLPWKRRKMSKIKPFQFPCSQLPNLFDVFLCKNQQRRRYYYFCSAEEPFWLDNGPTLPEQHVRPYLTHLHFSSQGRTDSSFTTSYASHSVINKKKQIVRINCLML